MGKFRSVSVILSVCTGFLVLMLVTLCTVAAKQYFDSRQAASRRLSIATIAQQLVVTDEDLRDERGAVDTVRYAAGPAGASDLDQIARFRDRSRAERGSAERKRGLGCARTAAPGAAAIALRSGQCRHVGDAAPARPGPFSDDRRRMGRRGQCHRVRGFTG